MNARNSDRQRRHVLRCVVALVLTAVYGAAATADDAQRHRVSLCVINRDGTGLRELLPNRKDGRVLEESQVAPQRPCWSPDGKTIVFDTLTPGAGFKLMTVDLDGSELRTLGPGLQADWSPDGKLIAFKGCTASGGACVMNADGSGPEEFVHGVDTTPKFSPNGLGFLYARDALGFPVYFFDFDSGSSRLLNTTPSISAQHLSWSPDGKWIIAVNGEYLSQGYEPVFVAMDEFVHRVVKVSLAGKNHLCESYAWSPDGKTILCTMTTTEPFSRQIYWFSTPDLSQKSVVVHPTRLSGQDPSRLNYAPAWSPDGKQIVFVSFLPDKHDE